MLIYVVKLMVLFELSHTNPLADREIEIVHDLAQRVLEYANMLCEISDICAEFDW